jgi:hypothetical protein
MKTFILRKEEWGNGSTGEEIPGLISRLRGKIL